MLSSTEIQKLYDHVEKHKVVFVDVQIELVDHFASEIESIQKENPSIDFQAALKEAAKKFRETTYGIKPYIRKTKYYRGFDGLILQKTFDTSKLLNRKMNRYFLSFIRLPMIILTLSIWIIFYNLIEFGEVKVVWNTLLIFQFIAFVYWIIRIGLFQKAYGKFISFKGQLFSNILMLPICYCILNELNKWLDSLTVWLSLIVASISTFLILVSYIAFIYFTDLLISEIKEKYGNHKLTIS